MDFELVKYVSVEISESSSTINILSDEIKEFLKNKDYGNSIKELYIGVVCVSPVFEAFFIPRKPKYTKNKKQINREGFIFEIEKCLEYDVKIDFDLFKESDEHDRKRIIAKKILTSIKVIEEVSITNRDFQIERYKNDLELVLKKYL